MKTQDEKRLLDEEEADFAVAVVVWFVVTAVAAAVAKMKLLTQQWC